MRLPPSCPPGPRLHFRDFTPRDIPAVHEYASDPEVSRWSTWGPNTLEQTTAFVEEAAQAHLAEDRTAYSLAATVGGRAIGSVGIWATDAHDRNGELGYTFNRSCWGKGYATEAVGQLLAFGFETLRFERISATCHPGNIGSIRVLEKSGFTLEGRLRSHRLVRGVRRDSLLYSILREEHAGPMAETSNAHVPTVAIRPYRPADAAGTLAIFLAAMTETAAADYTPEQIQAWARPETRELSTWHDAMQKRNSCVATVDGEPAGFSDVDSRGYIDMMFVAPRFLRLGVGRQLLGHVEALARAGHLTQLSANVSITARPFFERHGFVIEAEQHPVMVGVRLSNYAMRKGLPGT